MKRCKWVCVILLMGMLFAQLACGVEGTAAGMLPEPEADFGQALITWDTMWKYRSSNSKDNLVITEGTASSGLFGRFLTAETVSLGAGYKDRQIQFFDDSANRGLAGNVKPGDTVLLHIVCRSSAAGTTAKLHPTLYKAGDLSTDAVKSTVFPEVTVPDTWTEYYFPATVGTSEPNRFMIFLGRDLQSVDFAYLELINCGDTPVSQLPDMTVELEKQQGEGRRVLWWDTFWQRRTSNAETSNLRLTNVTDGSGMFSRYIKAETLTVDGNYKNRQLQYSDTASTKGFGGNLQAGETVLLHVICRSGTAGKTAQFQPAVWKSGDGSTDSKTSVVFAKQTVTDQWTEFWLPAAGGTSAPNRFALFIGDAKQTLEIARLEIFGCGETKVTDLPNSITNLETDENIGTVVDLFDGFTGQSTNTGYEAFPVAKMLTGTQSCSPTGEQTALLDGTKTLVFSFIAKATDACTPVKITLSGNKNVSETYYVPVQWTRIDMPVKLSRLDKITLEFEGRLLLAGASYDYRGTETIKSLSARSGMHLLEEFADVTVADTGTSVVGKTMDLVKSGNIIYSIGNGKLTITDVSDGNVPRVLGTLGNMGSAIRQIALLSDGKHVFITSRQNGCYIVNVEDPAKPRQVARYDSVEMATGVDVYGDYVYVCDRQYGVEIVDVSDVYNPVQCAIVRGGTAQSCKVVDGILYMGSWNERSVDMFDVTQPSDPQYLGSAPLNGKGDGMMVVTVGDRTYLYAATGQHVSGVTENISDSFSEEDVLADLRFGQGNGLDIFDVTDPSNPVWLSTSRIDGRYYFPNNDYWEVEIAEHDGRWYAYVLNTYNGVYVLDVTDPAAPVRVGRVCVTSAFVGVQSYSGRGVIFPYDQNVRRQSPIAAIAVEDGALYMASSMTDLHICTEEALQPYLFEAEEKSQAVAIETPTGDFYDMDSESAGLSGFAQYRSVGQTYAAVVCNDLIYAACGKEGVVVLDESLNKLATIRTQDICMDVQIYEDKLYCAESAGGLACYQLSADGLSATEQWRYYSNNGVVRQVRLSPKARWAIIQSASSCGEILSTDAPAAPVITVTANSQMYHHTVLHTLAGGRYTGVWAEAGYTFWFDFGVNDDYDVPVQVAKWNSNTCTVNNGSMTGGVSGYPNYVLATKNIANGAAGGYVLYDPTSSSNTSILNAKDPDTPFSGKPAVAGDLLITGERINGRICIVDISDIANPNVIKTVQVTGNPDIPYVHDDYVLVPMGYQGLIKFDLTTWKGDKVKAGEESYTTVAAAAAACEQGDYITLLADVAEDVKVSKDLYLDLNGKTLTGNITVSEGAKLYVFDSATSDYTATNRGKILGSITGTLEATCRTPESYGHNYRYLTLKEGENTYSFHRYYLSVRSVVLAPMYGGETSLNYKTVFKCNGLVAQRVTAYGAKLTGDSVVYTDYLQSGSLESGAGHNNTCVTALEGTLKKTNSASVNEANAVARPIVCAYIRIDGAEITSAAVQYSLQDAVVAADSAAGLSDAQKTALGRMYLAFQSVFDAWQTELPAIKRYASEL